MTDPTRTTVLTRRLLAPNPGPMTLEGTNSWVVGAPGQQDVVVVDPGPADRGHLEALAAAGRTVLTLITHRHADHAGSVDEFHALTGAPVRAFLPELCRDAEPLADRETIEAAGVRIRVLHTPGHTADSVCLHLPEDTPLPRTDDGRDDDRDHDADGVPRGSVLTGDTVLGRGTTVLDHPDGTLGAYLRSLHRLAVLGEALVLPGHAEVRPDLERTCEELLEHRMERLAEVREAVRSLGRGATLEAITARIYHDVPPNVLPAARLSVGAQLAYLGF
ncbi:MBL fold metallo-hydrolase [Kocuria dechangensis]|uniref:MBL fold metallo-hydrolase n=1 Tax=Kocuria dechangensis TaxID=1176249 RepID=A0A917GK70_9MICC|nr:MBL fold metallo-hydrolase [Kocuria dechangensis]GGG49433.1 MBL fold metallo-hydrolase [Kocuria dechangensis]